VVAHQLHTTPLVSSNYKCHLHQDELVLTGARSDQLHTCSCTGQSWLHNQGARIITPDLALFN
jgi:hypothetical protein